MALYYSKAVRKWGQILFYFIFSRLGLSPEPVESNLGLIVRCGSRAKSTLCSSPPFVTKHGLTQNRHHFSHRSWHYKVAFPKNKLHSEARGSEKARGYSVCASGSEDTRRGSPGGWRDDSSVTRAFGSSGGPVRFLAPTSGVNNCL